MLPVFTHTSIKTHVITTLQELSEYTGYDNSKDPTSLQFSGCAMRVFALKWHPEYDDIFITGGWDRHLKVGGVAENLKKQNIKVEMSMYCKYYEKEFKL